MNVLERNLAALARRDSDAAHGIEQCAPDPTIEARLTPTGAWTLCVQGQLEASNEDPEADGERIARHFLEQLEAAGAERLVLFGMGIYTLRYLSGFVGDILVVEPDAGFARAVLERVDLSDTLDRVHWLIGPTPERALGHPLFAAASRGLFLAHASTRRRAGALHDALAIRFPPGGDPEPLHIAVVPPLYGGSLPVAHAAARALRQLGHRVETLDLEPFWPAYQGVLRASADLRLSQHGAELRAGLTRLIGETLLTQLSLDPPDVVLALAQAPLDLETLARLRKRGIVRAFWFCEDAHVMPYWKDVCTAYDVFFHVQPRVLGEALRERGAYGIALPMAFDPELHRPLELSSAQCRRYGCDLSFVGAAYHNRLELLPGLMDLGLRLYGTGWPEIEPFSRMSPEPNVRQSSEASNLIFNASRVNLNLHSSPWADGVNPVGDYLNPRTFELAGAGGFQLVDRRRDLPEFFEDGTELVAYGDLAECRELIQFYLAHADERARIAERARERALREHTYRHRMEVAVDALRAGPVPTLARRTPTPTIGRAIRSLAPDEAPLADILRRLPEERRLDPDALYLAVAAGTGELSYEEKILLFLREASHEIQILNAAGDPA